MLRQTWGSAPGVPLGHSYVTAGEIYESGERTYQSVWVDPVCGRAVCLTSRQAMAYLQEHTHTLTYSSLIILHLRAELQKVCLHLTDLPWDHAQKSATTAMITNSRLFTHSLTHSDTYSHTCCCPNRERCNYTGSKWKSERDRRPNSRRQQRQTHLTRNFIIEVLLLMLWLINELLSEWSLEIGGEGTGLAKAQKRFFLFCLKSNIHVPPPL